MRKKLLILTSLAVITALAGSGVVRAACCYFSAANNDVSQPAQKAFITWDPATKKESFTVQPKFEGDARDFGMVIPTPGQPKLDEMPRDFFENLAIYTILMPLPEVIENPLMMRYMVQKSSMAFEGGGGDPSVAFGAPGGGVTVLESGVVGSLDYKIILATDPEGLFQWLKDNGYSYAGDAETLKHYIDKKWFFTVMKIDTQQMTKASDGSFRGDVTPTRFQFDSEKLIYPLKITQISVPDRTEALFYVQAPQQMDLQGSWSWMHSYRVMYLTSGRVCLSQKVLTPEEQEELQKRQLEISRAQQEIPGYDTTKLEWSRKLDEQDRTMLENPASLYAQYGQLDWGAGAKEVTLGEIKEAFWKEYKATKADAADSEKDALSELDRYAGMPGKLGMAPPSATSQPTWAGASNYYYMPPREAPPEKVQSLVKLKGHLQPGLVLTKFRKVFTRDEMLKDLEIVPVPEEQREQYIRILPQSPP